MTSTTPISVNDRLNKIIDSILEKRDVQTKTDHPVSSPEDLLGLTLRFAIALTKREAGSMSSYNSLYDCASRVSDIFLERGCNDLRTIGSIWGQFEVYLSQDWWKSSLEFDELWSDFLREESASTIGCTIYDCVA